MNEQAIQVLLVEDNPTDVFLLREALAEVASAQFRLTGVERLADALTRLWAAHFDVVLLDLGLPDSQGLETFIKVHHQAPAVPIVVLTGLSDETLARRAMQAGAQDYLVKGQVDGHLLARAIRYAIERKRAEEALRASERRFRALIENSSDAISLIGPDGTLLYESPTSSRILGYPPGERLGQNTFELLHPDDLDYTTQLLNQLLQQPDGTITAQFRFRHKTGSWHWIEAVGTNLLAEPSVQAIVVNYRDITERKQAEEQFRLVVEASPNALILVNMAGQITLANPQAERLFGYLPEELLGQPVEMLVPQRFRGQHQQDRDTFLAAPTARPMGAGRDLFGLRKDGSQISIEIGLTPITTVDGIFILATIIDISERKRSEAEIKQRNRELTLLNQVIAASANSLEPEAVLEIVCRELALVFDLPYANTALLNEEKTAAVVVTDYAAGGLPRERPAMLNVTFPVATSPMLQYLLTHKTPLVIADAPNNPHLAQFRNLLEQRGVASLLLLPLMIEGEVVGGLSLESIEPRHFLSDEINLAWSVADQVAGALARARLSQAQQRLSTVVEQTAESVIITDTTGNILYVNPAFERISGYSRAEVVGQNPRLLKSGQQDAAFYAELWATIKTGQGWRGRFTNTRKDGTLYTADATITPVRNESGAIVTYVGVQRDVTRELELEEQYRQAQKMEAIGRLSGGVAHDFNNLLVVITGYSELLLDRHFDAANPLRKYIEEISKAAERAAGLTRQLLAFSRQQVLQPEILALNNVVADTEKMLRRLIGEDIELVARLEPGLGQVKADAGQIEQILLNLAVNARDAMPLGGKLIIETANVGLDDFYARQHVGVEPGSYVMLAVSDTGIGMDAAIQSRIFEPFFTTKEKGKGTGLGLATVYGIVKQSGGDIWVYSEPGLGTTFKIYLPRVQETIAAVEVQPIPVDQLVGTETILLVEDEVALRALVHQVLEMSGYIVLEAAHGGEALLLCEQQQEPIHLLVTDVIMPHMSGRELATRLLTWHPEMKVLYMSGYTDQAIEHHGVLEPGLSFLQKPFSPYALARKVREVLDTLNNRS